MRQKIWPLARRFCPIMLNVLSRQRIKRTKSQIMSRILAALDPEESLPLASSLDFGHKISS